MGKYRSRFTSNDLDIIQQLVVDKGIASENVLNILFSLYSLWEHLPALASSNAGLAPQQIKLNVYGSTPELKRLFETAMLNIHHLDQFDVNNYKISDRSKIFSVSRDRTVEANFQPKLNNRAEIKQYGQTLNTLCQLEVAKQKAVGSVFMPYDPIINESELPYLQAAAGLSITTQYRAVIDKLTFNLRRQLNRTKLSVADLQIYPGEFEEFEAYVDYRPI